VDVLKIVPSHFRALLDAGGDREILPRRFLVFGGETLGNALVERIEALGSSCEIFNHYGPTETTVGSLTLRLKDYDWRESAARSIPIGRPIANTRIYLLDRYGEPVPVGVAGELYIAGAGVTEGYLGQMERTRERFVPNPFAVHGQQVMYRTGDLARYLPDGNVEFLGRADEQVKIRGFRIEPGEIEAVLGRHAGVKQAAVVALPDRAGDLRLVAYVVAKAGGTVLAGELEQHLHKALPAYMVPAAMVLLPKLPLNANGKLDRKALPEPEEAAQNARVFEAPVTETERKLAAIWAEVLKRPQVGRNDHFFEIGGHSLLATQVVSRVREALRIELAMRMLFDKPVLSALATSVDALIAVGEDEVEEIIPVSREEYRRR
jgi:acyl-coenzyme A synthetase/AMP-(fatty) acid ligase